ncbi:hypothetical protein, partial [Escherichia coli]|uniref:hypothetical protein n=1 Tax=Escherichia coli TaxID=562 RepID=UPI0039F72D15
GVIPDMRGWTIKGKPASGRAVLSQEQDGIKSHNLLCFNQDGNASLSPLSEKARSLLAQATVEAMRNELELKSAAVKDIQTDIY